MIIEKTSLDKLTAIVNKGVYGYTIFCNELDLATQADTKEEAIEDLIEIIIEYVKDYVNNFDKYSQSHNHRQYKELVLELKNKSFEDIRRLFN